MMNGSCEMCGLLNCGCEEYRLKIAAKNKDDQITQLTAKLEAAEQALTAVHEDLLIRADTDADGGKVVAVGYSVWLKAKAALPTTDKET